MAGIVAVQALGGTLIFVALGTWSDRASFGDMFGAINSLFSGLALAGVVYAILLQREELALQRQELELTRHELHRSAVAQEDAAKLLMAQLDLAKNTRDDQLAAERQRALPLFKLVNSAHGSGRMDFAMENHGASIRDLEILSAVNIGVEIKQASLVVVETGARVEALITWVSALQTPFSFELGFTDVRGERRQVSITYYHNPARISVAEIPAT